MAIRSLQRKLTLFQRRWTEARRTDAPRGAAGRRDDGSLWDTALGILNGTLAPGEYAAGLPDELRRESAARIRDLIECARLTHQLADPELQSSLAWIAAIEGNGGPSADGIGSSGRESG